jgi:hypothetical protein
MVKPAPWYARLMTVENVLLLGGVVLLLCSLGEVTLWTFSFRLAQDLPTVARLLLVGVAIVLALAGTTLHLQRAEVFGSTKLAVGYFVCSLGLIVGFGIVALRQEPPTPVSQSRVFKRWAVDKFRFRSEIETAGLANLQATHRMLLICRKHDSSIPIERDVKIQKSSLFDIDGSEVVQKLTLEFDDAFSNDLREGDTIECALGALPVNVSRDQIFKLEDIVGKAGQVRQVVFVDI